MLDTMFTASVIFVLPIPRSDAHMHSVQQFAIKAHEMTLK